MTAKRIRIFAGPNGSGKTTIVNELKEKIGFGVYVNADDIEATLIQTKQLNFANYNISLTTQQVQTFIKQKGFSIKKLNDEHLASKLLVQDNNLIIQSSLNLNSYIAADIAELIRQTLMQQSVSFSYETVMSHPAKLDFIAKAKECGFRIYLYFVATEDPDINISRVNVRVAQHGHNVSAETVRNRYYKSLANAKQAIQLSNRAYIFDNSGVGSILIAEITNGVDVKMYDPEIAPNWFVKYIIEQ